MSLTSKEAFSKLPQKLHNFFIKYPPRPFNEYSSKPSTIQDPKMNPFLANKNVETGRWHGAKYSLRRSADLFKMAHKFGIHDLLPPLPQKKFYEERYNDKNWMRGVLNQKKHKWERNLPEKIKQKEAAISEMDEIIMATRPKYRKQVQKREETKKNWW